jgi:hypothetical protein
MPPTLTHSAKLVDAVRKSRLDSVTMMGTTKQMMSASGVSSDVGASFGISASVVALAILIIGVLLLITGGGPPI